MAEVSSAVGGAGSGDFWLHKLSHGALGCAVASAKGSDCGAGATGGITAEMFVEFVYGKYGAYGMTKDQKDKVSNQGQLISIAAAGTAAALGQDINTALDTGNNAYQNNYLAHKVDLNLAKAKKDCASGSEVACNAVEILDKMDPDKVLTEEDRENLKEYSDYNDDEFNEAFDNCLNKEVCNQFNYLHVTQRNEWNEGAYQDYTNNSNNWVRQPDDKNAYHNYSIDGKGVTTPYQNTKYISKDGQQEIVVDKNNNLVIDPTNQGTYNYYSSTKEKLNHKYYDVDPYFNFGNNLKDKTTRASRGSVPVYMIPSGWIFGRYKDINKPR